MIKNGFWTSESVTEGHPDKMCDYISDSILDACLAQDKNSRVAIESAVKSAMCVNTKKAAHGVYHTSRPYLKSEVHLLGELTTHAKINLDGIVTKAVHALGYDAEDKGFNCHELAIFKIVTQQSPDIAIGVDATPAKDQGAGDQGMMFGYAIDHTEELMPLPIVFAHALTKELAAYRKSGKGIARFLYPDGKSQVTVEFQDYRPRRIEAVVLSAHHSKDISLKDLQNALFTDVIKPVLDDGLDSNTKIHINATGAFTIGGPLGDSGVTGRKIIVDTYGGWGRHGGGAFSGKDPSKVDRSGAYAARWIAKNIVVADLARACEIQISYAIGIAQPLAVVVDTFGTGKQPDEDIGAAVMRCFDLRPRAIIEQLDLLQPIYTQTTNYGHFGKPELPWEKTQKTEELLRAVRSRRK